MRDEYWIRYSPQKIAKAVQLITGASFVTGELDAPLAAITSRQACAHTGILIGENRELDRVIKTLHPREDEQLDMRTRVRHQRERVTEGFEALFLHHQQPGFYSLNRAGYNGRPVPMAKIQEWIQHLVGFGYRGLLTYSLGREDRHEYWQPECDISISFASSNKGFGELCKVTIERANMDANAQFYGPLLEHCLLHKAS